MVQQQQGLSSIPSSSRVSFAESTRIQKGDAGVVGVSSSSSDASVSLDHEVYDDRAFYSMLLQVCIYIYICVCIYIYMCVCVCVETD